VLCNLNIKARAVIGDDQPKGIRIGSQLDLYVGTSAVPGSVGQRFMQRSKEGDFDREGRLFGQVLKVPPHGYATPSLVVVNGAICDLSQRQRSELWQAQAG
jgi:hypothetical protein